MPTRSETSADARPKALREATPTLQRSVPVRASMAATVYSSRCRKAGVPEACGRLPFRPSSGWTHWSRPVATSTAQMLFSRWDVRMPQSRQAGPSAAGTRPAAWAQAIMGTSMAASSWAVAGSARGSRSSSNW